jgi:hypothetical protein
VTRDEGNAADERFTAAFQWQLAQFELEHEAHPDEPEEGVNSPLLLNPQADIWRLTWLLSHRGQITGSSLLKTRVSNSSSHAEHLYSYMGTIAFS